ncbi:uncharacterized protein LOC131009978 [Salvia miltiorrhiza]|uniref:uncharacterized protein LOC131009978 n=1 Tax=Salvia miltiorrhiza TaxID=226208 RepID=UPI0025ACA76E|nr:uncharacterized protein LOC131009978 [Salvia miltiorrhiza]
MCSKSVCLCCLFLAVLFASPFVIITTLSYVGVKPRFYIQEIYIPSLNNSNTHNATNLNTSIIIDLKFKRVVAFVPLRYEDVNITLYYGPNRSFGAVGSYVVAGFSQGTKKTTRRRAVVEARGLPWEDAFEMISGGSAVELATKYKLQQCDDGSCYYAKAKTVVVAADLVVDASGLEVSKKPIRLH